MRKITLIVGLPGSGKTHLALQMKGEDEGVVIVDDISSVSQLPEEFNHLIITDVNFIFENTREKAAAYLTERYSLPIEWIFFENNPEKCVANVRYRNDGRKVEAFINRFSPHYSMHKVLDVRNIWTLPP
jgi:KaiC/GvpD/RAD55 family RecA-like ATPase